MLAKRLGELFYREFATWLGKKAATMHMTNGFPPEIFLDAMRGGDTRALVALYYTEGLVGEGHEKKDAMYAGARAAKGVSHVAIQAIEQYLKEIPDEPVK